MKTILSISSYEEIGMGIVNPRGLAKINRIIIE